MNPVGSGNKGSEDAGHQPNERAKEKEVGRDGGTVVNGREELPKQVHEDRPHRSRCKSKSSSRSRSRSGSVPKVIRERTGWTTSSCSSPEAPSSTKLSRPRAPRIDHLCPTYDLIMSAIGKSRSRSATPTPRPPRRRRTPNSPTARNPSPPARRTSPISSGTSRNPSPPRMGSPTSSGTSRNPSPPRMGSPTLSSGVRTRTPSPPSRKNQPQPEMLVSKRIQDLTPARSSSPYSPSKPLNDSPPPFKGARESQRPQVLSPSMSVAIFPIIPPPKEGAQQQPVVVSHGNGENSIPVTPAVSGSSPSPSMPIASLQITPAPSLPLPPPLPKEEAPPPPPSPKRRERSDSSRRRRSHSSSSRRRHSSPRQPTKEKKRNCSPPARSSSRKLRESPSTGTGSHRSSSKSSPSRRSRHHTSASSSESRDRRAHSPSYHRRRPHSPFRFRPFRRDFAAADNRRGNKGYWGKRRRDPSQFTRKFYRGGGERRQFEEKREGNSRNQRRSRSSDRSAISLLRLEERSNSNSRPQSRFSDSGKGSREKDDLRGENYPAKSRERRGEESKKLENESKKQDKKQGYRDRQSRSTFPKSNKPFRSPDKAGWTSTGKELGTSPVSDPDNEATYTRMGSFVQPNEQRFKVGASVNLEDDKRNITGSTATAMPVPLGENGGGVEDGEIITPETDPTDMVNEAKSQKRSLQRMKKKKEGLEKNPVSIHISFGNKRLAEPEKKVVSVAALLSHSQLARSSDNSEPEEGEVRSPKLTPTRNVNDDANENNPAEEDYPQEEQEELIGDGDDGASPAADLIDTGNNREGEEEDKHVEEESVDYLQLQAISSTVFTTSTEVIVLEAVNIGGNVEEQSITNAICSLGELPLEESSQEYDPETEWERLAEDRTPSIWEQNITFAGSEEGRDPNSASKSVAVEPESVLVEEEEQEEAPDDKQLDSIILPTPPISHENIIPIQIEKVDRTKMSIMPLDIVICHEEEVTLEEEDDDDDYVEDNTPPPRPPPLFQLWPAQFEDVSDDHGSGNDNDDDDEDYLLPSAHKPAAAQFSTHTTPPSSPSSSVTSTSENYSEWEASAGSYTGSTSISESESTLSPSPSVEESEEGQIIQEEEGSQEVKGLPPTKLQINDLLEPCYDNLEMLTPEEETPVRVVALSFTAAAAVAVGLPRSKKPKKKILEEEAASQQSDGHTSASASSSWESVMVPRGTGIPGPASSRGFAIPTSNNTVYVIQEMPKQFRPILTRFVTPPPSSSTTTTTGSDQSPQEPSMDMDVITNLLGIDPSTFQIKDRDGQPVTPDMYDVVFSFAASTHDASAPIDTTPPSKARLIFSEMLLRERIKDSVSKVNDENLQYIYVFCRRGLNIEEVPNVTSEEGQQQKPFLHSLGYKIIAKTSASHDHLQTTPLNEPPQVKILAHSGIVLAACGTPPRNYYPGRSCPIPGLGPETTRKLTDVIMLWQFIQLGTMTEEAIDWYKREGLLRRQKEIDKQEQLKLKKKNKKKKKKKKAGNGAESIEPVVISQAISNPEEPELVERETIEPPSQDGHQLVEAAAAAADPDKENIPPVAQANNSPSGGFKKPLQQPELPQQVTPKAEPLLDLKFFTAQVPQSDDPLENLNREFTLLLEQRRRLDKADRNDPSLDLATRIHELRQRQHQVAQMYDAQARFQFRMALVRQRMLAKAGDEGGGSGQQEKKVNSATQRNATTQNTANTTTTLVTPPTTTLQNNQQQPGIPAFLLSPVAFQGAWSRVRNQSQKQSHPITNSAHVNFNSAGPDFISAVAAVGIEVGGRQGQQVPAQQQQQQTVPATVKKAPTGSVAPPFSWSNYNAANGNLFAFPPPLPGIGPSEPDNVANRKHPNPGLDLITNSFPSFKPMEVKVSGDTFPAPATLAKEQKSKVKSADEAQPASNKIKGKKQKKGSSVGAASQEPNHGSPLLRLLTGELARRIPTLPRRNSSGESARQHAEDVAPIEEGETAPVTPPLPQGGAIEGDSQLPEIDQEPDPASTEQNALLRSPKTDNPEGN